MFEQVIILLRGWGSPLSFVGRQHAASYIRWLRSIGLVARHGKHHRAHTERLLS